MYRISVVLLLVASTASAEPVSLKGIAKAKEHCSAIFQPGTPGFVNCVVTRYEERPGELVRRLEIDLSGRPQCREKPEEVAVCLAREGMIDPRRGVITYEHCIETVLGERGC